MGRGGERGTGREENTSQELWWRTGGGGENTFGGHSEKWGREEKWLKAMSRTKLLSCNHQKVSWYKQEATRSFHATEAKHDLAYGRGLRIQGRITKHTNKKAVLKDWVPSLIFAEEVYENKFS